ncbi:hypothetical protein OE766_07285 [Pararhizobium sp. YC-54]|uniref:hypothetical protein n=1 Tax=Pararhizobium sp. YC-54 TaxID=2986920 RepID=UPI0021F6B532|nr:hypothetical protein [Pararhizobium sp. YC-54]MCV9998044.1 hypothetical protein [Pararhizobium sp. YC-54]
MFKTIFAATALVASLSAPALAAGACDDASVMKTEEMAKGMTDPMKKDAMMMAMKEVDSAKMAMKDGKTDECSMHLDNAMKATEGK